MYNEVKCKEKRMKMKENDDKDVDDEEKTKKRRCKRMRDEDKSIDHGELTTRANIQSSGAFTRERERDSWMFILIITIIIMQYTRNCSFHEFLNHIICKTIFWLPVDSKYS